MKNIRIEKVTLNIGCGKDQTRLDKAVKLLKNITGIDPVKTYTSKRIPEWGLRPGLSIGCKITLRKKAAKELIARLLKAKDSKLNDSNFSDSGNISFGIKEYIDIPDVKYDPEIGIFGMDVSVTLQRPGYRIKNRMIKQKKLGKNHVIKKEDAIEFVKKEWGIKVD